jgi:2-iminobutanoate/2-iminopropanoate deaminase
MKIPGRRELIAHLGVLGALATAGATTAKAQALRTKNFLKSDSSQKNAYSDAVITEGGRTIWIAGQGAPVDASGKSLAGDFDAQARATFAGIGKTLERAGAKLSDMVTMTVFITDDRYGRQFLAIRQEIFGDNFPASALITIRALAQPTMLIEIQGVAVTG